MNLDQARAAAQMIAQEILSGTTEPYAGTMSIWKEIIDSLEGPIPDDLWPFKSNASAIEDCLWNAENSGANHDKLIAECIQEIKLAAMNLQA